MGEDRRRYGDTSDVILLGIFGAEVIRATLQDKVAKEIVAHGLGRSHVVVLDALLKLRQVCCDPRLMKLASARLSNTCNRGKIPGSRRYQAGWPRQRTRSGSGGTASWPGTPRRLPR